MAVIEQRGESTRVKWLLGGSRDGAPMSCTFKGSPTARCKLAQTAKLLIESRGHDMTRDEVYAAILGAAPVTSSVPTFKHWVAMYIADRQRLRDIQPDTIKKYRQVLESRAVPFLGHMRLVDITPEDIKAWVAWASSSRATQGSKNRRSVDRIIASATVRRAHAILHTCLGAAAPKWIPVNPAARPAGATKHKSGLPKVVAFEGMFLTAEQVRRIHEHADPLVQDLIFVAVRTGLRLGELLVLEARHVVFSPTGATVMVKQALKSDRTIGDPKSEKSRRAVTVGQATANVLRARVTGRRPKQLVFPSSRGKVWCENNLRERYWLRAVAAAQRCEEHPPPLPEKRSTGPRRKWRNDEVSTCDCPDRLTVVPRFHDLRHTHASVLIEKGWSAKKIQIRLGHASYQTTMNVYGHLMNSGSEQELEGVEDLLDGVAVRSAGRRSGSSHRPVRRAGGRRLLVRR
jgi:integrase